MGHKKTCIKIYIYIYLPHHFQRDEQLSVAEDNGGKGNGEAEAEQEHHIGFIVVFVVCGVPVGTTGALQAFGDVPREIIASTLSVYGNFAAQSGRM